MPPSSASTSPASANQRRNRWPGVVGLPITVTTAGGELGGAAAVMAICARSDDLVFWDEPSQSGQYPAEGGATAEIIESDIGIQSGRKALAVTVTGGPWSTALHKQQWQALPPIMGYDTLTFRVKTDGNAKDEIFIQLQDEPLIGMSEKTRPVPVVSGGYIKGGSLADDWREVSIPISRFMSDAGSFQPAMFSMIVLSGAEKLPERIRSIPSDLCAPRNQSPKSNRGENESRENYMPGIVDHHGCGTGGRRLGGPPSQEEPIDVRLGRAAEQPAQTVRRRRCGPSRFARRSLPPRTPPRSSGSRAFSIIVQAHQNITRPRRP